MRGSARATEVYWADSTGRRNASTVRSCDAGGRGGRRASRLWRELGRKAAARGGCLEYRATTAQWQAAGRARGPKAAKLAVNEPLRRYVQERLSGAVRRPDGACVEGPSVRWIGRRHGRRADRRRATAWSPEQIANRLRGDFPEVDSLRTSHGSIAPPPRL